MKKWLIIVLKTLISSARERRDLALENLALRQQLAILKAKKTRPRLTRADRLFWLFLSKHWADWRDSLHIVQPATVIRWHRQGFRYYWRWKSRRCGRPCIERELQALIREMSRENPLWGAPRIHGELLKLGIEVSQATVSKYMIRPRKPPSQGWKTFLDNHASELVSLDFLTVPTATFVCFMSSLFWVTIGVRSSTPMSHAIRRQFGRLASLPKPVPGIMSLNSRP
jgi:hypothetical protein